MFKKNANVEDSVLNISIKTNFLILLFKFSISFGFACFIITERDALNPSTMILDLSVFSLLVFSHISIIYIEVRL